MKTDLLMRADAGSALRIVRRHLPIVCLLGAGAVLRILAFKAFYPALEYPDSTWYLGTAAQYTPFTNWPIGYSVFLNALSYTGHLASVTLVQHLMGLLLGVLLYMLLCRTGVRPWLAAMGAAPLLLDAYQIDVEQFVLSETMAEALLVLAAAVLLWSPRPAIWQCVTSGLLLALAGLTRTALLPLVVPAALFVLLRQASPRTLVAAACLVGSFALPVLEYAAWDQQFTGRFVVSPLQGRTLYGRVAPFADCARLSLTPAERNLCPAGIPGRRPDAAFFMFNFASPYSRSWPGVVPTPCTSSSCPDLELRDSIAQSFALKVIRRQPGAYLRVVLRDELRSFEPGRDGGFNSYYLFPQDGNSHFLATVLFATRSGGHLSLGHHNPSLASPRLAHGLGAYQRVAYTPGPLLGLLLLAGLVAGAGLLIPSSRFRRLRWFSLALCAFGATVVILPAVTNEFDYRYLLPALVLLPPSGAAAAEVAGRTWSLPLTELSGDWISRLPRRSAAWMELIRDFAQRVGEQHQHPADQAGDGAPVGASTVEHHQDDQWQQRIRE